MSFARISTYILFLFVSLSVINGQARPEERIEWDRTIPDNNTPVKKNAIRLLEKLLLGDKIIYLDRPVDIILDSDSGGWVLSQENSEIIRFGESGISNVKFKRRSNYQLPSLVSGCFIEERGLVFSDSSEDIVYVLTKEGELSKLCSDTVLNRPTGVCYDRISETIWVVETGKHRVSVFNKEGRLLYKIGERGTDIGQFNFPTHITSDNKGRIYVTDAMNFRVQIFDNKGNYISHFGEHGDATGKFARPKGIAVDSKGNIYVADALFNVIQIFDREGRFLYYFGKKGTGNGEFMMPAGIEIDRNDYIYVSDSYNNRIQVFKPTKN